MVKLGILNSRMKDFFDIWMLSRQFDFEGHTLGTAIAKTFATRRTVVPAEPMALTGESDKTVIGRRPSLPLPTHLSAIGDAPRPLANFDRKNVASLCAHFLDIV